MNINDPKPGQDPKIPGKSNPSKFDPLNEPQPFQEPILPIEPIHEPTLPTDPISSQAPNQPFSSQPYSPSSPHVQPEQPKEDLKYSKEWQEESDRLQEQREKAQNEYNKKHKGEAFEEKWNDAFRNIRESKKVDEIYSYARENTMETIAYIFLILGIILLFINPLLGGFIVGVIAGIYFSREIYYFIQSTKQIFEQEGRARYVILAGVLFSLFVATPGFFVGAAIAVAFKQLIFRKPPIEDQDVNPKNGDFDKKNPSSNFNSKDSDRNQKF